MAGIMRAQFTFFVRLRQGVIMDFAVFLVFLFCLLFLGMRAKTTSSYWVADRKTSLFALTATLVMTEFNTATLIAFSSMGYLAGQWALFLPLVFLVGLLFYAITVAKKWKAFDGLSVASFFTKRYGRDIGILASVALLVAMTGFSAAYVKSLYIVFAPLFPQLNAWMLSGLLVTLVIAMMLRGGLFSIIRTDVFSFCVILFFSP